MSRYSKLRILFLLLDFNKWSDAAKWPYNALFGLEEGLSAVGIEPVIIPTPFLQRAQAICAGQHFDQVWMEIVHQNIRQADWLEWMSSLAPVRLGFMPESLEYTPDELAVMPMITTRRPGIETRLGYMTHVLTVDEADVGTLNTRDGLHALWWPMSVPKRVLAPAGTIDGPAVFPGTPYGPRQDFLNHPSLAGLIGHLVPPEEPTIYPVLFDALQAAATLFAQSQLTDTHRSHAEYLFQLRRLRRTVFDMWLDGIREGCALLNLPHPVKTYASRVYEGMAAGRAVISWDIPNRPRNRALFENGREILLYQRESPEELSELIRHLQREPTYAVRIADSATRKLRQFHTAERRVRHILEWIDCGVEPAYN